MGELTRPASERKNPGEGERGKKRTALTEKLKEIFRRQRSQPVEQVVEQINPILRGWVNYFRIGQSSRCFCYVKDWVEKKLVSDEFSPYLDAPSRENSSLS